MYRQIVVPTYMVNGGLDMKFENEPREIVGLYEFVDKISNNDFKQSIQKINAALKCSRAGTLSKVCLATGPLMLPLIPYAMLTYRNKRLRKKKLLEAIREFNFEHPTLHMRWRRKPISQLVIEDIEPDFSKDYSIYSMESIDRVKELFLNE